MERLKRSIIEGNLVDFVCFDGDLSVVALTEEDVDLFASGVEAAVVDAEVGEEDVLLGF